MQTVLIVIHLVIVLALVGVVLLQRSEGGGLGIGGGGGGMMGSRGAGNALTRTTAILAAAFFATSLALGILARYGESPTDILDRIPETQGTGQGILDQLGGSDQTAPPAETAPSAPSDVPTTGQSAVPDVGVPDVGVPDAGAPAGSSAPAGAGGGQQPAPGGVPTGQ